MPRFLIHSLFKVIGLLAVFMILSGFVIWIDPWLSQESEQLKQALNVWPVAAVCLILLGMTGRPALALLTTLALTSILFYINQIKWNELAQPLLLTDFILLPQVLDHSDLMVSYINGPLLAGLFLAWLASCWLFWTTEPRFLSRRGQILTLTFGLTISVILASPMGLTWYEKRDGSQQPWAPIQEIESRGWLAAAVRAAHIDLISLPNPDPVALASLKNEFSDEWREDFAQTANLPDLVVVLSESFFEPRHITEAQLCTLLPDWCRLLEEGQWGEMDVPTFGGNTTRTEYEVLTGVPYDVLPHGIYPYNSVVLRPTASIAWWLKSLGYTTTAIHPHDRYFWQRHRAMPLLGFDTFIGEQEFGPHTRSGFWISDDDLSNKVIQTLETPSDNPQFIFAISMENHGPWHGKRPNIDQEKWSLLPSISGLDGRADRSFRNYLYHQRQSIDSLNKLWTFAQERERSTAILFFGDHLPGLHATFRQISFESELTPLSHPVPYLLLQTQPSTAPNWIPGASYQLGLWFIEANGLPLPSDYAILSTGYQENNETFAKAVNSALYPYLLGLDPKQWERESCELRLLC